MQIYKYQFTIRNLVLQTDDVYEIRDGSVVYLYIHHDYMKRKLPMIRMSIELESKIIKSIYDNLDRCTLKFDLYEQQLNEDEEVIDTKLYMQHTFTVIPEQDRMNYITSQDTTSEANIDEMRTLQLFETYLIDMDAVNWFGQQICAIFQKVSKPAALQALFQMRNIPGGKLIATPPHDNNIIDYVTLPLGDLIGNIDTLNKVYGLYDSYPIVYYDLEYLYCVNRFNPNIILPKATDYSNITFILMNPSKPDRQVTGSCNDAETKTHYINLRTPPEINDTTARSTSTKFATVTSIDKEGTVNKSTIDDNATALKYVYEQNDMTVDQVVNENMIGHQISLQINNSAVSFLKPYKTLTFDVDTQFTELGITGVEYRLIAWTLTINRQGATPEDCKYMHDTSIYIINPKNDAVS